MTRLFSNTNKQIRSPTRKYWLIVWVISMRAIDGRFVIVSISHLSLTLTIIRVLTLLTLSIHCVIHCVIIWRWFLFEHQITHNLVCVLSNINCDSIKGRTKLGVSQHKWSRVTTVGQWASCAFMCVDVRTVSSIVGYLSLTRTESIRSLTIPVA